MVVIWISSLANLLHCTLTLINLFIMIKIDICHLSLNQQSNSHTCLMLFPRYFLNCNIHPIRNIVISSFKQIIIFRTKIKHFMAFFYEDFFSTGNIAQNMDYCVSLGSIEQQFVCFFFSFQFETSLKYLIWKWIKNQCLRYK